MLASYCKSGKIILKHAQLCFMLWCYPHNNHSQRGSLHFSSTFQSGSGLPPLLLSHYGYALMSRPASDAAHVPYPGGFLLSRLYRGSRFCATVLPVSLVYSHISHAFPPS